MESRSAASANAKVTEKPRPYLTGRATQPAARSDAGEHLGAEELAEIWEQERGALPALRAMTPERVARCRARLAHARDARAFLRGISRGGAARGGHSVFVWSGSRGMAREFGLGSSRTVRIIARCSREDTTRPARRRRCPMRNSTSFPPIGKPVAEKIAQLKSRRAKGPALHKPFRWRLVNRARNGLAKFGTCGVKPSNASRRRRGRELRAAKFVCVARCARGRGAAGVAGRKRPTTRTGAARVRPEVLERWKKRHAG